MTAGPVDTPTSPTSGVQRWLKWALIASLAVNLLIIGSAVGHRIMGQHGPWRGHRSGDEIGILGYARTLDPERRASIRKLVQADRPTIRTMREEIVAARVEAANVLAAEPFDKEKARAALTRIGEIEARMKSTGLNTILSAVEQMTAAERSGFVEWWKRRRPHHFREPRSDGGRGKRELRD